MNVDKFLEEQKEFLKANSSTLKTTAESGINNQESNNQIRYDFASSSHQARSIFGSNNAQLTHLDCH